MDKIQAINDARSDIEAYLAGDGSRVEVSVAQDEAVRDAIIAEFDKVVQQICWTATRIATHDKIIAEAKELQAAFCKRLGLCKDSAALFNITLPPLPDEALSAIVQHRPVTHKKFSVKAQIISLGKEAFPKPVRVSQLREAFADAGIDVHEKTVGMSLNRLSKAGVFRREGGRDWYYCPSPTEGIWAIANPRL